MAFYIFPNAIPKAECKKYLNYCLKNADFEDASTIEKGQTDVGVCIPNNPEKPVKNDNIRKTSISFLRKEDTEINQLVWGFIRHANKVFFNYELSYFQSIQFAKYNEGGHYNWHQDSTPQNITSETRKLSLTFSLADHNSYEGGGLQFYNGERPFKEGERNVEEDIRTVGSVIVFDSRDWHRVTPVTKGVRYSIVCWTVGPNFV
jgi:PKHD-type hydroxylase